MSRKVKRLSVSFALFSSFIFVCSLSGFSQALIYTNPSVIDSPDIGQLIDVKIKIKNGKNVAGFEFNLDYDPNSLQFVKMEVGDHLPNVFAAPAKSVSGQVSYSGSSAIGSSKTDTGILATATFKVLAKEANKTSQINITSAELNDESINLIKLLTKGTIVKTGAVASRSPILRVPQDHRTIQSAVNVAEEGDTVLVESGTWGLVKIDSKNITLKSARGNTTVGGIEVYNSNKTKIEGVTVAKGKLLSNRKGTPPTYEKYLKSLRSQLTSISSSNPEDYLIREIERVLATTRDFIGMILVDSDLAISDCKVEELAVFQFAREVSLDVENCSIGYTSIRSADERKIFPGGRQFAKITINSSNIGSLEFRVGNIHQQENSYRLTSNVLITNSLISGDIRYPSPSVLHARHSIWQGFTPNTSFKINIAHCSLNANFAQQILLTGPPILPHNWMDVYVPTEEGFRPRDHLTGGIYNSVIIGMEGFSHWKKFINNGGGDLDSYPVSINNLFIGSSVKNTRQSANFVDYGNIFANTANQVGLESNNGSLLFQLKENSICIDAGFDGSFDFGYGPVGYPHLFKFPFSGNDYYGNPRVVGKKPDIGPIEFQLPTPPSVPTPKDPPTKKDPPVDVVTEETDTPKPTEPLLMKELSVNTLMGQPITSVVESKDGKKLSKFTVTTKPKNGKLTDKIQNGKVTLTYIPNPDFVGTDSFKYKVSDGTTASKEIQVDITVKPKTKPITLQFSDIDSVNVDELFAVKVLLGEIKDLAGWSFNLEYDPEILSLESVEEGDFLKKDGGSTFFQKGTTDQKKGIVTGISSAYLGTGGISDSGNLLTINLKSLKGGEGYLRIKDPRFGSPKGAEFPIKVVNSTVTVSSVPPCDVNANGTVDIFDLILVAQIFGQKSDSRSDTNGDGEVNIFDLIVVAQCFGQGAAPSIVEQPLATFSMVENWVQLSENADDGSEEFIQGISMLKQILESLKPDATVLMNNYPNPFNPETWIPYHLSQDSEVVISIYDTTGKIIRRLDLGFQSFGFYVGRDKSAYWDGRTESGELVSSGTYFYQLETDQYSEIRKMVILK